MNKILLLIEEFALLEFIFFKRDKPARLLWIVAFIVVFHIILQLCSPPSLLILQITNIIETFTCLLSFSGIVLLLSRKPTRAQWFFIFIFSVYIAWVSPCLVPALLVEKLVLTEIIDNPYLRILDGLLFMSIILYSIEIIRPNYLKFRTIFRILSLLLIIPVLGIVSNHLKNNGQVLMIKFIFISRMLFIVGYPLIILIYLQRYKKDDKQWYKQNYANMEKLNTSWFKYYIVIYLFISITYMHLMLNLNNEALLVLHTIFPLFFVFIFPFVLHQQELVKDPEEDDEMQLISTYDDLNEHNVNERQTYSNSRLIYKQKLIHWMEQDKPYLNMDFRLIDIMNILPLNRKYISRLINEEIGETFFSFVMKYRINESIRLLESKHNLTIAKIAIKSGFSSPSVFGRSFLKEKGISPLEYRKQYMLNNRDDT